MLQRVFFQDDHTMKSQQLSSYLIVDIFILHTCTFGVSAQATPTTVKVSSSTTNGSTTGAVYESTTSNLAPTNATVVIQSNPAPTNGSLPTQSSLVWSWASVPDPSRAPYDACGNAQAARVCDPDYVLTQTQRADIQGAYLEMLARLFARAWEA